MGGAQLPYVAVLAVPLLVEVVHSMALEVVVTLVVWHCTVPGLPGGACVEDV